MITFYSSNPAIPAVVIGWTSGQAILKVLHLPLVSEFTLEPDQLGQFKSMLSDVLHFDGEVETISNRRARYGYEAEGAAQYIKRIVRELFDLTDQAIQTNSSVMWKVEV